MIGDVILVVNKKKSFFPSAIKFFTGRLAKKNNIPCYTHACYSVGDVLGFESVLSAELSMSLLPLDRFRTEQFAFKVFRITDRFKPGVNQKALRELIRRRYERVAGKDYAFLQNLWFVYRYIMEWIGFDMRGKKNWFPNNENCSEDTANYLLERFENLSKPNSALSQLKEFNRNSIHPVDLGIIIKNNPNIFKEVESYGFEEDGVKKIKDL